MNYKSIFNLLGILLGIFSLSFIPPLVLTFVYRESGMEIFLYSFIFFSILGSSLWAVTRQQNLPLNISDGFIITTLFWVVLACAGSIPFYFFGLSISDSIFESVSGITTTGATTIVGLDNLPKSILFVSTATSVDRRNGADNFSCRSNAGFGNRGWPTLQNGTPR